MPPWIFNIPGVHIVKEKIDFFRNRNSLGISYPDWKQRAITVDVVNRSTHLAENVRVFLTIEDSELNLGIKNTEIQMEIMTDKIESPFKSRQMPSKIEFESVCFAERDLQGHNLQSVNIPPKSKRTADLIQADVYRGYLDVASELGFSTNGGQSRALLEPQKCFVAIIRVESNSSSPRDFPVLIHPYEQQMPLREFSGFSFYRLLRANNIFFGPLQWEELSFDIYACLEARKTILTHHEPQPNAPEDFILYQAKEVYILLVAHKNGLGTKIAALLSSLKIGQITFLKVDSLEKVAKELCSLSNNWNEERHPFFEAAQNRKEVNNKIIEHLKNGENWVEDVLCALKLIKNRVFEGAE